MSDIRGLRLPHEAGELRSRTVRIDRGHILNLGGLFFERDDEEDTA